jgi:alpha-tubulin suppressor-like RCC1 family protein
VTTQDVVYCWGNNRDGQIGDSTEVTERLLPTKVAGGRTYRQVDAGAFHTCAVSTTDQAFCWGNGRAGELGTGKAYLSFWPRRVVGRIAFVRVTAGGAHSCGKTSANSVYCWGSNFSGALGSGAPSTVSLRPVVVAGGISFKQVSAGSAHTCGVSRSGIAYCWGSNQFGELGDGTKVDQWTPKEVVGAM